MVGRNIAHYAILEKLGEGGMGAVWKARDTRLDRFVALKTLRFEKLADDDRRRRFVQEAKAASALNHPNIVHIYDIANADEIPFIAMEFVQGKTLHQMIGSKGLQLNEALRYAIQIADALAKAHEAGIVHRDLKPSNVMVTSDGVVKVLDFGLAKLTERASGELGETATMRTDENPRTAEGFVVGTVAYMSPEQAEAKRVDARSDIFSFGSLLYEMITGRRAFRGDSTLSTLSAILRDEPQPISSVVPDVPRELERLLSRCLRKDPQRRFQHVGDIKLALEELKEDSESGRLHAPAPARSRLPIPVVAALVLLLLAVAGAAWWLTRSPGPAPVPTLTRLTWDSGLTTAPALSPDGRLLAYASDRSGEGHLDIYLQQVGGGEPLRLTRGPGDKHEPAFSPDGTTIAFRSEQDDGIYLVSTLGGPARKLAPNGHLPQFSPNGRSVAYSSSSETSGDVGLSVPGQIRMYVVASSGGAPRQVRPDFVGAARPTWAPDGEHLLFLGNPDNSKPPEEAIDWWVTPLGAGPAIKTGALDATRTAKLSGGSQVSYPWALAPSAWEPGGNGLVFSARAGDSTNLWRMGISSKTWKVIGPPQRLTSGATREESPSVVLGPGGVIRIAFTSVSEHFDVYGLPIKPNEGKVVGELQQLTHDAAGDVMPTLSRDGNRMMFVSQRPGNQEVWIRDLRTGQESALTASRLNKWAPIFSPDGSQVAFAETRNVYIMPSTGGAPEMVCAGCGEATSWSPDGKRIIGNTVDGRAWVLDLSSRRRSDLVTTRHWIATDAFSPDGRWFSFLDATSWRGYIALVSDVPIAESAWIDIMDGELLDWSPDGKLLYGNSGRDGHDCIWAQRVDPVTKRPAGVPFAVFHFHNVRLAFGGEDVTLGVAGGRMVFSMGERTGNIWMTESKER